MSMAEGWTVPIGVKVDAAGGSALGEECLGFESGFSLGGSKHTVFGATNFEGTFSTSMWETGMGLPLASKRMSLPPTFASASIMSFDLCS